MTHSNIKIDYSRSHSSSSARLLEHWRLFVHTIHATVIRGAVSSLTGCCAISISPPQRTKKVHCNSLLRKSGCRLDLQAADGYLTPFLTETIGKKLSNEADIRLMIEHSRAFQNATYRVIGHRKAGHVLRKCFLAIKMSVSKR
eukprot:scaffold519_cov119-Skeletonema_dohrnii-CCMP3373.AAC.2